MKKSLTDVIAAYSSKEKFWLNCFADTGNARFLKRAMSYKSKIEVLQSFGRDHLPGFSLTQINNFQNRAHDLAVCQLELFSERGDGELNYMNVTG